MTEEPRSHGKHFRQVPDDSEQTGFTEPPVTEVRSGCRRAEQRRGRMRGRSGKLPNGLPSRAAR